MTEPAVIVSNVCNINWTAGVFGVFIYLCPDCSAEAADGPVERLKHISLYYCATWLFLLMHHSN